MAFDLNLRTEWIDSETVQVSWNEPHMLDHKGETVKGPVGYVAGVCILAGLFLPFLTGIWILLVLLPLGLILTLIGMRAQPLEKSVVFGRDETILKDRKISTNRISRIAMDDTLQWTTLTDEEKKKTSLKTQILIWVDEEIPFEVSINNIDKATNLKIRNALAEALVAHRKKTVQVAHEQVHGKVGRFGMPDY